MCKKAWKPTKISSHLRYQENDLAMHKPSELLNFLEGLGIHPKKALSQNFLIDGNIIRKIVSSAGVHAGDVVLEIGPGPGSLTAALLDAGAQVIAIEKDRVLAEALKRFEASGKLLEIVTADVLECALGELLIKHLKPGHKGKVIANLPYHITTPIVAKLLQFSGMISDIVIMVQDEVAKRFVGKPRTPDYGSLTLFLNYYTEPKYVFKVSRNCFYPAPNVDSAVVHLKLRPPPLVSDENRFFQMTRTAFKQRRKMLRVSLKQIYLPSKIEEALQAIGKSSLARPEELSLAEFIAFFEQLQDKDNNV